MAVEAVSRRIQAVPADSWKELLWVTPSDRTRNDLKTASIIILDDHSIFLLMSIFFRFLLFGCLFSCLFVWLFVWLFVCLVGWLVGLLLLLFLTHPYLFSRRLLN